MMLKCTHSQKKFVERSLLSRLTPLSIFEEHARIQSSKRKHNKQTLEAFSKRSKSTSHHPNTVPTATTTTTNQLSVSRGLQGAHKGQGRHSVGLRDCRIQNFLQDATNNQRGHTNESIACLRGERLARTTQRNLQNHPLDLHKGWKQCM